MTNPLDYLRRAPLRRSFEAANAGWIDGGETAIVADSLIRATFGDGEKGWFIRQVAGTGSDGGGDGKPLCFNTLATNSNGPACRAL